MVLYRNNYKAKRVWKWLIKPSNGPANFQGIELDIVQFPDNRLDCWVDGKHCPEVIEGLTLPITKKKIAALAGDDNATVEIRG